MPRVRPNSRVKDLPDIALLSTVGSLEAVRLRQAIDQTFEFRDTHPVPDRLPDPPEAWSDPYREMAKADGLDWPVLSQAATAASSFLNPVLDGTASGHWDPASGGWSPT